MRSYFVTLALAAIAVAESTITDDVLKTIYSCGPSITNCPGSTYVPATSVPEVTVESTTTTTECPEETISTTPVSVPATVITPTSVPVVQTTSIPVVPPPHSYAPPSNGTSTVVQPPPVSTIVQPPPVSTPVAPSSSFTVVTYTSCVPTTWVSTIPVAPTSVQGPPTSVASGYATGTGANTGPSSPISPPIATGAASSIQGSHIAAGAVVLAAMFM